MNYDGIPTFIANYGLPFSFIVGSLIFLALIKLGFAVVATFRLIHRRYKPY